MKLRFSICCSVLLLFTMLPYSGTAQDTLRIDLSEFIERGLELSGQVAYERTAIDLADNRVNVARAQRILPRVDFSSQHGVIPGVVSKDERNLPPGQWYLDPNLENDWEDWAIFTRAEINAIQPLFSWGAIGNAIQAAQAGARAVQFQFSAVKAEAEVQLLELYYSYLLSVEITRVLEEATDAINQFERRLEEMIEDADPTLKESDIFKFEILKSEFKIRVIEAHEGLYQVERLWNYLLKADQGTVYLPKEQFLEQIPYHVRDFPFYQQMALQNRPELRAAEAGRDALRSSREAVRAQQFPLIFLGITGSYANTPNRPRQTNPFIINSTNYASAGIGFGIRQNLNFSTIRTNLQRADIEYRRVNELENALQDGIMLELNNAYREAVVAESRVNQSRESLTIARNWVRNEQLNYDIGFGDVEDLLDALQKELEIRFELNQYIFELNKKIAELLKTSGLPVRSSFEN
ncbi:MAG: TolC family protein [Balneolaceae bacterium]|nr:MAG: TolC family protein [Balneolaceae bacterium]